MPLQLTLALAKKPSSNGPCIVRTKLFSQFQHGSLFLSFDEKHFDWEKCDSHMSTPTVVDPVTPPAKDSANKKAAGHKRDLPAQKVVTTATSSVEPAPPAVKAATEPVATPPAAPAPARPQVDFACVRAQVTMEQVLRHLGFFDALRGRSQQRRGPCPLHGQPSDRKSTFSVHLGKNVCQCFQADCAAQGNVLDLWAAVHRLPLYEAALHLSETFHLHRTREEEPVNGTR